MKEKQYVVSANAYCKEGKEHHVTIVGVYKRIKEKGVEVIDEVDEDGVINFFILFLTKIDNFLK